MPGTASIQAFELFLHEYEEAGVEYLGMVLIFPDYGTTTVSPDGKLRTWSFTGPMTCTGLCSVPTAFTLEARVEIRDQGDDLFEVRNYRRIPEVPDHSMDADDVYVIRRQREGCSYR
jgi:hypothetical protein